jgi:hypothetical protein
VVRPFRSPCGNSPAITGLSTGGHLVAAVTLPLAPRWHIVCNDLAGTGNKGGTPVPKLDANPVTGQPPGGRGSIVERGWWASMKHSASRELFEYWNRVRGKERAPHRSAIEPSDIRRILADTFILEVVDRETLQVRLAGTRVCSIYCRELKGTNFLDLWRADDRSAMGTLAAAVAEDGAAAVVTVEAKTGRDQEVAAELLLLPLRHSGPTFDRILGSFATLERPYWLGTEAVDRPTIASLRLIWPDEQPHFMRRRSDMPQIGPQTGLQAGPQIGSHIGRADDVAAQAPIPFPARNSRRRGHLFVVDGGKQ